jgi:signal transduction histidine kinase
MVQSEKLVTLGTMVSGVAHELNNPLSNIYSSCQILQEEIHECDCTYTHEMLTQIASEIERAKTMVQSLLEFSRKTDFKRKPYLLKDLIEDTIRLIHGDLPARVEIVADIPGTAVIFVDKQRMEQVFLNLIKNAVDAIPEEGKVSIRTELKKEMNEMDIIFEDNGAGIEPEKLDKIFDPFFTTKDDGKGSGLGLFITREIIEDHRGTITVESTPARGTAFTITLPVKEV